MNGLQWLSSNCGAKNRLRRIPLDKSVYSCEAERKSVPQLRILIEFRQPIATSSFTCRFKEPPAPLTRPGWISSFDLVTGSHMTCTGLNLCQHELCLSQSAVLSLTDRQMGVQEPRFAEAEMNLTVEHRWSVQNEALQSCSCHEKWQIHLIKGGSRTTKKTPCCANNFASIFGTRGSVCAVSCRFDGALGTRRDPGSTRFAQSLSLCQKNVPQSPHEWCLLWYYHVFHQTRFISRGSWNMFAGGML